MAPIVATAGLGLYIVMPRPQSPEKLSRRPSTVEQLGSIDYMGVTTLVSSCPSDRSRMFANISKISSIVLLLFSLSSPKIMFEPIVFSIALLVAFVVIEVYYAKTPIVPAIVLRSRGTLLTCLSTLGMMMARYVIILYTPIYFMTILSWGPAKAGSSMFAVNGGFAIGGLLVGWLHIRRAGSFYLYVLLF